MSTFQGRLEEFPGISIDRFDHSNLTSEAFFLSHCHTDHMEGLDSHNFHQHLLENNLHLYVSHISAEILKNTYPNLSKHVVELDMHTSTLINLKSKLIWVTPIPAGHCPGSVMFLFEGEDKTVLYTGDYRINSGDIQKFRAFYDSYDNKKRIDAVYLDTTFFLQAYAKFPPRADSLEEICNIIKDWISRSDKHVIGLNTSAKYGYEYLFMEIYKKLKMPVHVNNDIYEFYNRVPELDKAVTRNKDITRIHSACGSTYTVICLNNIAFQVKTVKVSAFRWKSEQLQNGISETHYNTHYVCYSTHASYEEGYQLLKFLKPKKVRANVLHKDQSCNEEIFKNIEDCLDDDVKEPKNKKIMLFKINDDDEGGRGEGTSDLGLDLSILDSPPRK